MERLQREVNDAEQNAEEEDERLQLIEREINHLQTIKNVIGKSQEWGKYITIFLTTLSYEKVEIKHTITNLLKQKITDY